MVIWTVDKYLKYWMRESSWVLGLCRVSGLTSLMTASWRPTGIRWREFFTWSVTWNYRWIIFKKFSYHLILVIVEILQLWNSDYICQPHEGMYLLWMEISDLKSSANLLTRYYTFKNCVDFQMKICASVCLIVY